MHTKFLYFTCIFVITTALLIAASIYCYLIKYRAKPWHLLLFHVANSELKGSSLLINTNKKWLISQIYKH